MKVFVVRLNPDTRGNVPYSKYPTKLEYESIHKSSPMDGFHEAVNFLSENGVVRGYLPPRHLSAIRTDEPFILVTITAKTARLGGDMVMGIQARCKYKGQSGRLDGPRATHALGLIWHYTCEDSMSLLFDQPIPDARRLVLGKSGTWVRGPTYEIKTSTLLRIVDRARKTITGEEELVKLGNVVEYIKDQPRRRGVEITSLRDIEQEFAAKLAKAQRDSSAKRKMRLKNANPKPAMLTVSTTVYSRNPDVVAEVLHRANGKCEFCKKKAPFNRKKDDTPYLEVHHVKPLSMGGPDEVSNAMAACPNCHRQQHDLLR